MGNLLPFSVSFFLAIKSDSFSTFGILRMFVNINDKVFRRSRVLNSELSLIILQRDGELKKLSAVLAEDSFFLVKIVKSPLSIKLEPWPYDLHSLHLKPMETSDWVDP